MATFQLSVAVTYTFTLPLEGGTTLDELIRYNMISNGLTPGNAAHEEAFFNYILAKSPERFISGVLTTREVPELVAPEYSVVLVSP